jgi:hypothetical protein
VNESCLNETTYPKNLFEKILIFINEVTNIEKIIKDLVNRSSMIQKGTETMVPSMMTSSGFMGPRSSIFGPQSNFP